MVPPRPQRMLDQKSICRGDKISKKDCCSRSTCKILERIHKLREELLHVYLSRYGRFSYITPRENRALMRYQGTEKFIDPLTVYGKAGVKLVSITRADLSKIKARDLCTIEHLLEKAY